MIPFLVVKQDSNGTTLAVSDDLIGWLLEYCGRHAKVTGRDVSAREHATQADMPCDDPATEASLPSSRSNEPPF